MESSGECRAAKLGGTLRTEPERARMRFSIALSNGV
jgi:hypothetical protein